MCQIRKKPKEIKTQQEKNVGNISDTKQTENVKIYSNRGKVEGKLSCLHILPWGLQGHSFLGKIQFKAVLTLLASSKGFNDVYM